MNKALLSLLLFGLLGLSSVGYAQTSGEEAGEDAEVTDRRPDMPELFFTPEQRKILEAIRQGVVETEVFAPEEIFEPVIISDDIIEFQQQEEVRVRGENIAIDSLIRSKKSGKLLVWMNNELVDLAEEAEVLEENGLTISDNDEHAGVVLKGTDSFSNTTFELEVGQSIVTDGNIEENLPVIIRRSKK